MTVHTPTARGQAIKTGGRLAAILGALTMLLAVFAVSPAQAAEGCSGGSGCSHQTGITFNNQSFDVGAYQNAIQWYGPNTVLRLEGNGNLALYCNSSSGRGTEIWNTNTVDNGYFYTTNKVTFQSSGNMSLWHTYADPNLPTAVWVSLTEPPTISDHGHIAIVQADGNFVIYDAAGNPLWSSKTYHVCPGTSAYQG